MNDRMNVSLGWGSGWGWIALALITFDSLSLMVLRLFLHKVPSMYLGRTDRDQIRIKQSVNITYTLSKNGLTDCTMHHLGTYLRMYLPTSLSHSQSNQDLIQLISILRESPTFNPTQPIQTQPNQTNRPRSPSSSASQLSDIMSRIQIINNIIRPAAYTPLRILTWLS